MQEVLNASLASMIVTILLTRSHALGWMRRAFRNLVFSAPDWLASNFVMKARYLQEYEDGKGHQVTMLTFPDDDVPADAEITGYDFISCGLCVGAWVSFAVCLFYGLELSMWLPVYGGSYLINRLIDQ